MTRYIKKGWIVLMTLKFACLMFSLISCILYWNIITCLVCAVEYLHCKAEIIKDIPLLDKTTPPLLVSAQACVARSMEENWYWTHTDFFNFSVFFACKEKHFRRKQNERYLEIFHIWENFRSYNASMYSLVPSLLLLVKWSCITAIKITLKFLSYLG